jgi:hypothetical protein
MHLLLLLRDALKEKWKKKKEKNSWPRRLGTRTDLIWK